MQTSQSTANILGLCKILNLPSLGKMAWEQGKMAWEQLSWYVWNRSKMSWKVRLKIQSRSLLRAVNPTPTFAGQAKESCAGTDVNMGEGIPSQCISWVWDNEVLANENQEGGPHITPASLSSCFPVHFFSQGNSGMDCEYTGWITGTVPYGFWA
jgi:hypothetical protein